MNDFANLEKLIVRELSCRLCLCTDVVKLKPLSEEVKRKLKRLFNIAVRTDDNLPKAICHECLHQINSMYLYSVKVDKTQKFLFFHKMKALDEKKAIERAENTRVIHKQLPPAEQQQGDVSPSKNKPGVKKKPSLNELKFMESMTIDEFASTEKVDKSLLESKSPKSPKKVSEKDKGRKKVIKPELNSPDPVDYTQEVLDPLVLIDGRPARQGAALDRQITLFYKMECCICHEKGFHFKSLMKHYKDRHGVPGYVTCCDKKFHYFYPRKIIEHMAYHLQPNIFMCTSCHQNFHSSQELKEHQANGGRSEGKITCPRCPEKFPTYRELGWHIVSHRTDKTSCDYCGKLLKHTHRKKNVNHFEDVILCSQCHRLLRNIEKQEKEVREKVKAKVNDTNTLVKHQKFREALELSAEDGSTD